jgi:phage shock protein C
MYCNSCGAELPSNAIYCHQCGRAVGNSQTVVRPPLERPRQGRKIAGVCLAVARHLGVDPTLMRVLWVLAAFLWLGGIIAYIVGWILIPEEPVAMTTPVPTVVTPPHAVNQ